MNRLIIITGISGSGKTTIAKTIHNHYANSTLISLDTIKTNIYDLAGFNNYEQKQSLKPIIYSTFIKLLEECLKREDENIIIEYPFNKNWEPKFQELVTKYHYEAITIRVKGTSFHDIYQRLVKRDNSSNRHPGHSLIIYNPKFKEDYVSTLKLDYEKLEKDYQSDKYTSIAIGKTIDFLNNTSDLKEIIELLEI